MKHTKVYLLVILSIIFLTSCKTKENPSKVEASILLKSINYSNEIKKENDKENDIENTIEDTKENTKDITKGNTEENTKNNTKDNDTENKTEETLDITLYLYDADDYYNPSEKKVISVSKELYENDMTDALNYVFEETEIRINNANLDKETSCITVDIPLDIATKFNAGSCNGTILTNELIDTILNLPDVQSAIITVDGEKDCYSDHYSFEGTFTLDELE